MKKMKLLLSIILVGIILFTTTSCDLINKYLPFLNTSTSTTHNHTATSINKNEGVVYDDFQIHFMTLGNDKAGDSIYIKAGNTDIVIDAGSRQQSTITTKEYMNQYINDNKIEYVILTHKDKDHIEGFTDTANNKGILSSYKIDTIIENRYTTKTTATYKKYLTLRDSLIESGTKLNYADDCYNNTNDAKRDYQLSDKVTMSIIYNYYYFNTSSDENNYSVCTMFTYNDNNEKHHFFFTGDLEKEGEEKMALYYDGSTEEKTLPEVDLFKAGHHGSKTSSNDCLLSIIKPKMCVITCCCGTNEYTAITDNQFPTQDFISRISKYTDNVYATTVCESFTIKTALQAVDSNGETKVDKNGKPVSDTSGIEVGENYIDSNGYKDLNGNIIVSCSSSGIGLAASKNLIKLKDSEWFNQIITIDGKERPMRIWN